MTYSNSSLVTYTKLSPNHNDGRVHSTYNATGAIDRITIHHMAGNLSVETCGNVFAPTSRQASSNYGIGSDGRIGMYVEEKNRAWTSGSPANDYRAITIEVANDEIGGNWHVSDKALAACIDLCVDICKRNGIAKLNYTGDTNGNLTKHCWFQATSCPGPYLGDKFDYIAEQVNIKLGAKTVATPTDTKKSTDEIAKEVIAGKWGNGDDRKNRLTAAGYDYSTIQNRVNQMVSGSSSESTKPATPAQKSVDEIAKEVINGAWGNGSDRKTKLEAAGYNYSEVQSRVNAMLGSSSTSSTPAKKSIDEIAKAVIRGDYGNGSARKQKLEAEGYNYSEVQARVNQMLS